MQIQEGHHHKHSHIKEDHLTPLVEDYQRNHSWTSEDRNEDPFFKSQISLA